MRRAWPPSRSPCGGMTSVCMRSACIRPVYISTRCMAVYIAVQTSPQVFSRQLVSSCKNHIPHRCVCLPPAACAPSGRSTLRAVSACGRVRGKAPAGKVSPGTCSTCNRVFTENLVGLRRFFVICFLLYQNQSLSNPREIITVGKSGPADATVDPTFLGLGWPWVGEFDGVIIIFICSPTQQNLVYRKHCNNILELSMQHSFTESYPS